MFHSSLEIGKPFGKTLILSMLIFGVLFLVGELITRTTIFRNWLIPGFSSNHRQFEVQLTQLQEVFEREGEVDCIFLGSSTVMNGFDPEAFAAAFRSKLREDLRCFNFGVDGMTAAGAGPIAAILVDDFRPRLLIYGTDARDYGVPEESAEWLLASPWIRYRSGRISLTGWLIEHSRFFRYFEPIGKLTRFQTDYVFRSVLKPPIRLPYGFMPITDANSTINTPPSPDDENPAVAGLFGILSDYQIWPGNISGLKQIRDQHRKGVQVLILEMPVPSIYMSFFGNGAQDHDYFVGTVSQLAKDAGIQFWRTNDQQLIPNDGWADYNHLSHKGASIFSQWLGQEVATSVGQGALTLPERR